MTNSPSILLYFCIAISGSVFASNEDSPLAQFKSMVSTWPSANTQLWVNSRINKPDVLLGEKIYFSVQSDLQANYVLFVLDSANQLSIIKPKKSAYWQNDKFGMTFPALPEGCRFPVAPQCQRLIDIVEAELPAGPHEVVVIATDKTLPNALLGMKTDGDFYFLDSSQGDITKLLDAVHAYVLSNKIYIDIAERSFNIVGEIMAVSDATRSVRQYNKSVVTKYQKNSTAPDVQKTVAELIGVYSKHPTIELNKEIDEQTSTGSITFTSGTTTLDSAGRNQLRHIGRLAQAKKRAQESISITIVGAKNSQTKKKLTLLREETVKNYLQKRYAIREKELHFRPNNIGRDERGNAEFLEIEKIRDDGVQVILVSK